MWKIHAPLETTITVWLAFSNKFFTWEVLLRRGFNGQGYYALCRVDSETTSHIFLHFPYAGIVWDQVTKNLDPAITIAEEESLEHREKNGGTMRGYVNTKRF